MEFNEAHSHARQMGKFFKAFAFLEEVLEAAAGAEQATRNAQIEKTKLDGDISKLSQRRAGVEIKMQQAESALKQFEIGFAERRDKLREELNDELNVLLADNEIKRETAVVKLQVRLDEAKTKHAASCDVLQAEIETLTKRRDAADEDAERAEKAVSELRAKVDSL